MNLRTAASILSIALLMAAAFLLLRSNGLQLNRFQLVQFGSDGGKSLLLDRQEGRIWERRAIPLPSEHSGWFEMPRLDAPHAEQVRTRRIELIAERDRIIAERDKLIKEYEEAVASDLKTVAGQKEEAIKQFPDMPVQMAAPSPGEQANRPQITLPPLPAEFVVDIDPRTVRLLRNTPEQIIEQYPSGLVTTLKGRIKDFENRLIAVNVQLSSL